MTFASKPSPRRPHLCSSAKYPGRPVPRGFTLIELLVVIAIIALLIAMLLPALGKARRSAWHVISESNIRQVCTASAAYQDSYKGYMPVVALRNDRGQIPDSRA